uniref:Uncharacterized protein n=1 Tax=Cacopsylla melanoneura TaxID=428564 RepID=A0A8D8SIH8_9HEMI
MLINVTVDNNNKHSKHRHSKLCNETDRSDPTKFGKFSYLKFQTPPQTKLTVILRIFEQDLLESRHFSISLFQLEKLDIKTYARWNIQKSVILETCHLVRKFLKH